MKNLVKTNSLPSLGNMMEDFWNAEGFFGHPLFSKDALPAVNIKNRKKDYLIEVAAPGFKKEDFKVNVEDGQLRIFASSSESNEEETEEFTRREFSTASFQRAFALPQQANCDKVKAVYKDGLLKITLDKDGDQEKPSRTIKID
ncbi:Hsp20/alpha crystallin family protein [Pedobacter ureilyticus]|uniref:Hsp20/alpha crystallin family protein n=1 Tax=Pedobacter ureilyticus TaxID=1393051 RepID=A0ABW9JAL5_9SPHI|nr:Hsp20/alpha crystallin family protein [Pedobacter helvus]